MGSTPTSGTKNLGFWLKKVYTYLVPFLIAFLLTIISFVHFPQVLAQNQQSRDDYNYTFSVYQQSYSQFQQSRQAYLKHSTLNTKELVIQHAREAQINRINTVKTFLTILKENLQVHQSSSPTETQITLQNINEQVKKLDQLSIGNKNSKTIASIQKNNDDFLEIYKTTQETAYQSQVRSEANRLLTTLEKINNLLEILSNDPISNPARESWLDQTRKDVQKANEEINQALSTSSQMKSSYTSYKKTFSKSLSFLEQSRTTQEKILKNIIEIKTLL